MLVKKVCVARHSPKSVKTKLHYNSKCFCYRFITEFTRYCIVLKVSVVWLAVCIVLVLTLNFEVGKIAIMRLQDK